MSIQTAGSVGVAPSRSPSRMPTTWSRCSCREAVSTACSALWIGFGSQGLLGPDPTGLSFIMNVPPLTLACLERLRPRWPGRLIAVSDNSWSSSAIEQMGPEGDLVRARGGDGATQRSRSPGAPVARTPWRRTPRAPLRSRSPRQQGRAERSADRNRFGRYGNDDQPHLCDSDGTADTRTKSAAVVTLVTPSAGPSAGGPRVTIKGRNFVNVSVTRFGTVAASDVSCPIQNTCIATSPAGQKDVEITIATPAGTSAINRADRYAYRG